VHELATNALKYGALSVPEGRVTVTWERCEAGTRINWVETGGPLVGAPSKRGYGNRRPFQSGETASSSA
jgi:two-component sensor histidine kinase